MKHLLAAFCLCVLAACAPPASVQQQTDDTIKTYLATQAGEGETVTDAGHVLGDLDNDKKDDLALVWMTQGPTYWSYTLTVFKGNGSTFKKLAEMPLSGTAKAPLIDHGTIAIDQVTYVKGDPICCPTLKQTQYYGLNGAALSEIKR